MKETYPLQWPSDLPRTMIGDRENRKGWKKTERQSIESLENELRLFAAIAPFISRKDPQDIRSAPDPSIAVHFSRKKEDDYSWQGALGISNPAPTVAEINGAFRRLAAKYHTDRGGDLETYLALDKHKQNALAFCNRMSGQSPEYSIGCDKFKEVRWNILAIAHTIWSFRRMERDGTSRMVERSMSGFKTALPQEASHVTAASR